MGCFVTQPMA